MEIVLPENKVQLNAQLLLQPLCHFFQNYILQQEIT